MGKNKEVLTQKDLIIQNLSNFSNAQCIRTDDALRRSDASSLTEHNIYYTTLLRAYVEDFKNTSIKKRKNQEELFKVAKNLLLFIPLLTFLFLIVTIVLFGFNKVDFVETLPGLFTALASLLGTYMVIPKMITKYLFNENEEEHLAQIIGKIQKYDKDIRNISKSSDDVAG